MQQVLVKFVDSAPPACYNRSTEIELLFAAKLTRREGMQTRKAALRMRRAALVVALLVPLLAACGATGANTNRPTAATILQITPAPTQNIDATATVYASRLVPTPTPAGLYIIQKGDTLSSLANEFGTTVDDLLAANGLTDANAIQVGQPLLIPSLISQTLDLGTPDPAVTAAPVGTPTPTFATP